MARLHAPENLQINYRPSARQYEVWKALQPECPYCGGEIIQEEYGTDMNGNPMYKPRCSKCGEYDIPELILCGGAAGGGKSHLMSAWLISSCIRFPNIRMAVARKTLKMLKESTVITMKNLMREWGLVEDEHYHINNLEGHITYWNGSRIIFLEMSDDNTGAYDRFGSIELSGVAIDEISEISQRAVEILFSRIRYALDRSFKVPKMVCSCNPCLGWVRSRFVQDDDGNPVKCAMYERFIPFSVWDNPNPSFRATYIAALNKLKSEKDRQRLLFGNWSWVDSNEAAAYWKFDGATHLVDSLREKAYDPLKPLILSFDFNVAPYMSCLVAQIDYDKKNLYILEEILGKPEQKENNTPNFAEKIRNKYLSSGHMGGLVITGDTAGLQRSTQTADGTNNYTILLNVLSHPILRPTKRLLNKQPSQITRLEFINSIFDNHYDGWTIQIDMRCRKFTEDLIYQKKNSDGTKSKAKVMDPKLGVKYEKYGHLSDCFDMMVCTFLTSSWKKFQNKESTITTVHNTTVYQAFDY